MIKIYKSKFEKDAAIKARKTAYQLKWQKQNKSKSVQKFLEGDREAFWTYKLYNIKKSSKQRNLTFDLTKEDLEEQWIKQNGQCFFSKIKLKPMIDFNKRDYKRFSSEKALGLDRINSLKGYIKNNIIFVSLKVNIMKGKSSEKEFIEICKKIYLNSKP